MGFFLFCRFSFSSWKKRRKKLLTIQASRFGATGAFFLGKMSAWLFRTVNLFFLLSFLCNMSNNRVNSILHFLERKYKRNFPWIWVVPWQAVKNEIRLVYFPLKTNFLTKKTFSGSKLCCWAFIGENVNEGCYNPKRREEKNPWKQISQNKNDFFKVFLQGKKTRCNAEK